MVIINEEFQKLIPVLATEEFDRLEESIKNEGCRDALVFWGETLVDGHNRLKICKKHNIPYEKYYVKFDNSNQAKIWIINNQLARRNLTKEMRWYLVGKQYELEKKGVGKHGKYECSQNDHIRTTEKIAEQHKVSPKFVQRAASYYQAVEKIPEKTKKEILTREIKSSTKDVDKFSKMTPELQRKVVQKIDTMEKKKLYTAIDDVVKEHHEEQLTVTDMPLGEFDCIYADPPWTYKSTVQDSANVARHYSTMSSEEIKNLEVPSSDDCILFLWTTGPQIQLGFEVLNRWGFIYKGMIVWDKEIIGMGSWIRWQHEILLIGIKGNIPTPRPENRFSSMVREKRGKHSKKPVIIYEIIEKMFPNRKYLELFAREKYSKKWNAWGNQIGT